MDNLPSFSVPTKIAPPFPVKSILSAKFPEKVHLVKFTKPFTLSNSDTAPPLPPDLQFSKMISSKRTASSSPAPWRDVPLIAIQPPSPVAEFPSKLAPTIKVLKRLSDVIAPPTLAWLRLNAPPSRSKNARELPTSSAPPRSPVRDERCVCAAKRQCKAG